ncbi:MAG: antitoxin family protein [Theionarchaea archaeon]|nr:antitoxin family protein [Theionarchaea archaeon]
MEIDVIYEEGVFKPLKKVDLKEETRLTFIMGKDRVEKILQDLKNLEPLDIEIDDERLEWDYYAETMSL